MRINTSFDINLTYLSDNIDLIKESAKRSLIAMVKADAYGHGLLEISKFLVEEKGIETLGVASLGEALFLRQQFSSKEYEIFVFSDFNLKEKSELEFIKDYNVDLVLSSLSQLECFLSLDDFKHKRIILKFDTGMHRLGIEENELPFVIELLKKAGRSSIYHLMTHFSSSYLVQKKTNHMQGQLDLFNKIKNELANHFEIHQASVSNSGAIEQKIGFEFSHIRPGIMLYGPQSYPNSSLSEKTKLISSLRSYILKKRFFKKGEPIGYGRSVCPRDGIMLYLALGYGDGLLPHMSGLKLKLAGVEALSVGRINMDVSAFLISEEKSDIFKEGAEIYLWKNDNDTLVDIYTHSKTSPYHILTSITSRVPRRYFK